MSIVVLALCGAVNLAIRASFVVNAGRVELPAAWREALDHARPATLAALLVATVLDPGAVPTADGGALLVAGVALVASVRLGMIGTTMCGLAAVGALALV